MRKIKALLVAVLVTVLPIFCVACGDEEAGADKTLAAENVVGVAVYQNSEINEVWDYMCENPASANSLILTKDGKISYSKDIEHLFFVYTSEADASGVKENFISNTTIGNVGFEDKSFSAEMEVYPNTQEFLVYIIVKTQDKYILKFAKKIENFVEEEKTVELGLSGCNIDKLKLLVSRNLTINSEY